MSTSEYIILNYKFGYSNATYENNELYEGSSEINFSLKKEWGDLANIILNIDDNLVIFDKNIEKKVEGFQNFGSIFVEGYKILVKNNNYYFYKIGFRIQSQQNSFIKLNQFNESIQNDIKILLSNKEYDSEKIIEKNYIYDCLLRLLMKMIKYGKLNEDLMTEITKKKPIFVNV
jgi:hypothetical protein